MISIKGQIKKASLKNLKAGQEVIYTGTILTARDQAHKKIAGVLASGGKAPVNLKDAVIYYCGPTPYGIKNTVGSAGPTTSSRMDDYTEPVLKAGAAALIGKGSRDGKISKLLRKYGAVYFVTIAGAGAYLAKKIKKVKVAAYKELGAEAVYEFQVEDFPLVVAIDSRGNDLYSGRG